MRIYTQNYTSMRLDCILFRWCAVDDTCRDFLIEKKNVLEKFNYNQLAAIYTLATDRTIYIQFKNTISRWWGILNENYVNKYSQLNISCGYLFIFFFETDFFYICLILIRKRFHTEPILRIYSNVIFFDFYRQTSEDIYVLYEGLLESKVITTHVLKIEKCV